LEKKHESWKLSIGVGDIESPSGWRGKETSPLFRRGEEGHFKESPFSQSVKKTKRRKTGKREKKKKRHLGGKRRERTSIHTTAEKREGRKIVPTYREKKEGTTPVGSIA